MGADQHHSWNESLASALDWWQEAGVDTLVEGTSYPALARDAWHLRQRGLLVSKEDCLVGW